MHVTYLSAAPGRTCHLPLTPSSPRVIAMNASYLGFYANKPIAVFSPEEAFYNIFQRLESQFWVEKEKEICVLK